MNRQYFLLSCFCILEDGQYIYIYARKYIEIDRRDFFMILLEEFSISDFAPLRPGLDKGPCNSGERGGGAGSGRGGGGN
jgi:hypothetical protein